MKNKAEHMGEIFSEMSAAQGRLLAVLMTEFENRAHMSLAVMQLSDLDALDDDNLKALGRAVYLAIGVVQLGLNPSAHGAEDIQQELPAVCYMHLYRGAEALAKLKEAQVTRLTDTEYN